MAAADAKRQEERVRLFASALSNTGVAAIVASVIGPIAAGRFQPLAAVTGFVIGAVQHIAAQALLHYVVEDEPKTSKEITQ
jgi:hypothetical protein